MPRLLEFAPFYAKKDARGQLGAKNVDDFRISFPGQLQGALTPAKDTAEWHLLAHMAVPG